MRHTIKPLRELGDIDIANINLDYKSRDDTPAILIGLQHLYTDQSLRERLFTLLEEGLVTNANHKLGRPGMDLWQILVMGVVMQGLGCDFDRLQDLVNHHSAVRQFLGHADIWDKTTYSHQTIVDNVTLLTPELLAAVGKLIVDSGHKVSKKKLGATLHGRCDSFVVETDVHYPTDVNLLWDAMRCLLREIGHEASASDLGGWRQWKHLRASVKQKFHAVRKTRRASVDDVKAYLGQCDDLVARAEETLVALRAVGVTKDKVLVAIANYLRHAHRQIDQIGRRLLQGETIPTAEKVYSIFEEHTRWISKGKAGVPVELGVPVCVLEDDCGFILHHRIMWKGSDVDHAQPMVEETQFLFPSLRACSFDRGFHSPANRVRLDELLAENVLPRKGRWSKADRERESGSKFVAMRKKHPGIESKINGLEHHGLARVRAYGADGFERVVALSVVASNIHHLGRLLRRKKKEDLKRLLLPDKRPRLAA